MKFLLLFSAMIAGPTIERESVRDMLATYLRSDASREAAANIRAVVSPEGKVLSCTATDQIGSDFLAGKLCSYFRLARFEPAKGLDGLPAYAVVHTSLFLHKEGSDIEKHRLPTVLTLDVDRLPDDFDANSPLRITLWREADGTVSQCSAGSATDPQLGERACEKAGEVPFLKLTNKGQGSLPHVQEFTVGFIERSTQQ